MDVGQRQVPPDVADVAEVAQQLAHDRLGPAAVGTLEVAVLDDGDRRFDRAADVVALRVDVDVEVGQRFGGPEQRRMRAAARQQRGRAEEQPRDERRAERGAEDAELRLLELASPSKASVATSSETVKPMPAIVPPPATAAQPTGGAAARGSAA